MPDGRLHNAAPAFAEIMEIAPVAARGGLVWIMRDLKARAMNPSNPPDDAMTISYNFPPRSAGI